VAGYTYKMVYPQTVTHPSTNRARRRVTTWIETNAIPLSQTTATINITEQYNEARTQASSCVQAILTYLKMGPCLDGTREDCCPQS